MVLYTPVVTEIVHSCFEWRHLMYGFTGKIASVNLSSTVRSLSDLEEDNARKFLGGSGLGAQLLSSMNWKLPVCFQGQVDPASSSAAFFNELEAGST